jgi:hypothetical protein
MRYSVSLICLISSKFTLHASETSPYTKCTAQARASEELMGEKNWCTPPPGKSHQTEVSLKKFSGDLDVTLVIPGLKNCRTPSKAPSGLMVIALDNSGSLMETDPDNKRLNIVSNYLKKTLDELQSSFLSTDNQIPRLGTISYAGRTGFMETDQNGQIRYQSDGLNPVFTKKPCSNNNSLGEEKYPSEGHNTRWNETNKNNQLLSQCEYLPLVKMTERGSPSSETADRQVEFLKETTPKPRGATDYLYVFEASKSNDLLSSPASNSNSQNLIMISDGLPDLPIRRPESFCKEKAFLRNAPILTSENGKKFCYDSQFRVGVNQAHDYIEKEAVFQKTNIHHILYAPDNSFFVSQDDEGQLNPADFLIENSARSGDGSVKFYRATSDVEFQETLESITHLTSEESLQRIEINIKGSHSDSYQAVSTADFKKTFDLKFVGLQKGSYEINVRYLYGDSESQQTWNVTVEDRESTNLVTCEGNQDGTLTVDGDERDALQPKGDGFFPRRDKEGHIRAYRNNHPLNVLSGKYSFIDGLGGPDPRKMRLQGGAGNFCAVSVIGDSQNSFYHLFLLLSLLLATFAGSIYSFFKRF